MGLSLVISDYQSKNILNRIKVTPVSPVIILVVQVGGYTLYSLASLLLLYVTARVFFGYELSCTWLHFLGRYFFVDDIDVQHGGNSGWDGTRHQDAVLVRAIASAST